MAPAIAGKAPTAIAAAEEKVSREPPPRHYFAMHHATIYTVKVWGPRKAHIAKLRESFRILKQKGMRAFKKATKVLKFIIISGRLRSGNKLRTKERAWLSGYRIFEDSTYDPRYIASLLLHEVCHISQALQKRKNFGERAEREAYQIQRRFLVDIGYTDAVSWLDQEYRKKWWKAMDRSKKAEKELNELWGLYKDSTRTR